MSLLLGHLLPPHSSWSTCIHTHTQTHHVVHGRKPRDLIRTPMVHLFKPAVCPVFLSPVGASSTQHTASHTTHRETEKAQRRGGLRPRGNPAHARAIRPRRSNPPPPPSLFSSHCFPCGGCCRGCHSGSALVRWMSQQAEKEQHKEPLEWGSMLSCLSLLSCCVLPFLFCFFLFGWRFAHSFPSTILFSIFLV
jgi:hypothetical protein